MLASRARAQATGGITGAPLSERHDMIQGTSPISREAKSYFDVVVIVGGWIAAERRHHMAARSGQVLLDEFDGVAELYEPSGFGERGLRRRRRRAASTTS